MKIGKIQTVTVPSTGKTYTLSRLTVKILFAFRDWVEKLEGDPFDVTDRYLDRMATDEGKLKLIKEADETVKQLRGFSLASPLAQRYLRSEVGITKLYQLLLEEHHPGVTMEEAEAVTEAVIERAASDRRIKKDRVVALLKQHLDGLRKGRNLSEVAVELMSAMERESTTAELEALQKVIEEAEGSVPNGAASQGRELLETTSLIG